MIKKSLIVAALIIISSLVFNFSYSQENSSTTATTSTTTNQNESSGDVYSRASETYKYVSSFDGSESEKTFNNQNTKDIGSLFNYLLTIMAVAIVILVIYRLLAGAVIKGTFDNIYDQMKGREYIKTAGTALIIFIFAYAILSFINPDLTGWSVATKYIGQVRLEGVNNGGTGGGSGAYNSAYAWQCPINPGGFEETQKYVQKVQGYQKEKPWTGSGSNSGCRKYDAEFTKVASESGVPKDFMMAIGTQESSACSLGLTVKSKADAIGIMQILEGTASSANCGNDWKSSAYNQISCAAKVIKSKQVLLQSKGRPSIGFELSGTIQNIEGYTFDTGNANLIASYNGGPGEGTTSDGKKQAFAASSDCKGSTGSGSLAGERCEKILSIKESDLVDLKSLGINCTQGRCQLLKDKAQKLKEMDDAYFKETGKHFEIRSSYRSDEDQLNTCKDVCNGRTSCQSNNGGPACAAACSLKGNGSNHSLGDAIDIKNGCENGTTCNFSSDTAKWLTKNGSKYGFINKLPKDGVHYSSTGN